MRFRSGRCWSRTGLQTAFSALVLICGSFLSAPQARATIVVAPAPGNIPGNFVPLPTVFPPVSATSVYYPAINSAEGINPVAGVFVDPNAGFATVDFGKYQYTSPSNYILVSVTPYIATFNNLTNGGFPFLVVTMPGTVAGNPTATTTAVIASTPNNCPSPGGTCSDLVSVSSPARGATPAQNNIPYWRAFPIQPNQTITLALDMTAICDSTSQTGTGCSQLITPAAPGGTGFTTLQLTFGVYIFPTAISVWTSSAPQGDTPTTVSFNFSNQPASGSLTCSMGNAYFPGDQNIIVDGTQFLFPISQSPVDSLSNVDVLYSEATPASPPNLSVAEQIVPSAANAASKTSGSYSLQEFGVTLSPGNAVGPFINSTATDPVYYAVGYIGRDSYGYLVAASPTSSCAYTTVVQTASIDTFLQASKCFIATATFRTADSPPLVLLRAFRDRFLERFSLGQGFVRWYYAWSPGAAEWLVRHPVFRFPIFLALIPLQVVAWLVLNPLVFMFLLMLAISILTYGASLRLRKRELPE